MEHIKLLQELGFEEKEAKVYLILLRCGEITATKISQETSLDRTLIYQITNKLVDKGLVSFVLKNGKRHFIASEPETISRILKEKQEKLSKALPDLNAIMKSYQAPAKVELYQGRKGIYSALKMVISRDSPYYCNGGMEEVCTKFKAEAEAILRDAEKTKVRGKVLARRKDNLFIGKNEELKFLPDELFSTTSLMISGNKSFIFVWSEPYYAIVIDNKEVAKDNMTNFWYLWRIAGNPTKAEIKERIMKD